MSIFIALIILSFLVFFHELGHFFVARLCGVRVEVFSIGFGKKIASVQIGQTQYALSLIPLGGYVKLKGQDDSNPKARNYEVDSYLSKSPMQRIAILLAGPLFNLLLAFFLYIAVGIGGKLSLLPVVGEVKENYPAYLAGIKAGDRILSINDEEIKTWEELDSIILSSSGELLISIERDPSQIFNFHLTPIEKEAKNILKEKGKPEETITVSTIDVPMVRKGDKIKLVAGNLAGYFIVEGVTHNGFEKTMEMELERI